MSRKVGYPFKPLPDELPLIWQDLDLYPRLILQELWRMSTNGFLRTRLRYLVRDMRIAKKADRGNAQTAVATLTKEGLLKEDADGVRIALECRWGCVGTTEVGTSAIPTQAKASKSFDADLTDQIKLEEKRERSRAHARETPEVEGRNPEPVEGFVPARRPLPEPPPDLPVLPPPRKSDRARVHELLAEALGRTVDQLAPDLVSADLVARAARAETGEDEAAFEAAVRRMLAAWQADPHPRAKKHSLANMVMHLTKYTAPTRHVVKPARPVPVRVPHPYLPNATTTPEDRDRILAELDRMTEMGNALEMAANG